MSEFVDPLLDEFGELSHEPPALGGCELAPIAGKRALGRLDRRIDVGGLSARDLADLDAARRVFDRQAPARTAARPSAR